MRKLLLLCVLCCWQISTVSAQQSALPEGFKDDFKPATTNQAGKEYPQVNSEGRIKFRVMAPDAKSVSTTIPRQHRVH